MHYAVSFVYLISALSISLFSQNLGVVTVYNSDNSDLTYNQINCLEFDSENRLWIGTQNGLSVFNETISFNTFQARFLLIVMNTDFQGRL